VKLEVELSDAQLAAVAERVAELVREREERWLSQKELARHLGCSVRTVSSYHRAGMPHLPVGSHPRYRASECEAWLRERAGGGRIAPATNGPAPLQRPGPGHQEVGPDAT
jgi:hypothetical protein